MPTKEPSFDYARCLQTSVFDGDFGEPGDRTFRDQIVIARYRHTCQDCDGCIRPGEEQRTVVMLFQGRVHTYRFCVLCCKAMTKDDAGEAWSRRCGIGCARRRRKHAR
jgi:hypothetical protein